MAARGKRDGLVIAAEAQHAATERLLACDDLTGLDLRTFLAVLHEVSSWSRLVDGVAVRQLARVVYCVESEKAVSGWQRERIAKSLGRLADRGVILYVPGVGRYAFARVGLVVAPPLVGGTQALAPAALPGRRTQALSRRLWRCKAGCPPRKAGSPRAQHGATGGHTGE